MAEGIATAPLLRLDSISKSFGPVRALRDVSLDIREGEVLALIGENGAGKSTLMKVLSGAHRPDAGTVTMGGRTLSLHSPGAARKAGIAMIYQELTLAPHLTVEENVTLGLERAPFGFLRSQSDRVRAALQLLGASDLSPAQTVGSLTIARQQLVEIARAIVSDARVVIMDEPTSSLSEEDKQALFQVIRKLRDEGLAIVYISHFLDEVDEIADRYSVLRDGATVGAGLVADSSAESLIEQMIGRTLDAMYPRPDPKLGEVVLSVDGIHGVRVPKGVSFELRRGEILGLFGLVGAGRTELARCLFGLDPLAAGSIDLHSGAKFEALRLRPIDALDRGLDYLSEDRKAEGLAQNLSITENTTLSAIRKTSRRGFLKLREEQAAAERFVEQLGIRCAGARQAVSALSGGNQQKVALARMIHHDSDIFFMDEPTRGIDVGSKHEIYELIHALAAAGKSIIVISSYLPELVGICHHIAVMHRGKMGPKRPVAEYSESEVMMFATTGK